MKSRTRAGRLAAVDAWLLARELELLQRPDARFVDVGFGAWPVTTCEWLERVRPLNASAQFIGVDRESAYVEAARAVIEPGLSWVHGGFEVLPSLAPVGVVRAFNVLRGLTEPEAISAHEALLAPVVEGGLCLEGSTDTDGHVTVFHVLRGGRVRREALVFHTDFERGFGPWMFRDWLPRDLRRRVRAGGAVHAFFEAWSAAFEDVRADGQTPQQTFARTAERLAASIRGVVASAWHVEHGFLEWRPVGGVPTADSGTRCG